MAIRNLRFNDDEILRKKCRVVDDINDRIKVLVEDMIETMYENNGVGLAAPQVGILKRIFVVDAIDAEEFLARAIQHEYDHLEGVLFIDHEL